MAYTPYVGDGTLVYLDTGAAWTQIRGLRNFKVGAPTKTLIDRTELHDSAVDEIGGKVKFGQITCTMMFSPDDTTHIAIETSANTAGSTDRIYVKYPGADHYVLYSGSFLGLAESFDRDAMIECEITLALSTAPVRSITAPAAA